MIPALVLAFAIAHAPTAEPAASDSARIHLSATTVGTVHTVEASRAVAGTVRELRKRLVAIAHWPLLFSDTRAVQARGGEVWSMDFAAFGHPHDFVVTPTGNGVMLTLAEKDHGEARLEYSVRPLSATEVRVSVRFIVPAPPALSAEQMAALLRAKAIADLESLARTAPARRKGGGDVTSALH